MNTKHSFTACIFAATLQMILAAAAEGLQNILRVDKYRFLRTYPYAHLRLHGAWLYVV